ncbi:hypothetical protein K8T06_11395, partial [bacterium]|nr:hypothetical protein [bacterium]
MQEKINLHSRYYLALPVSAFALGMAFTNLCDMTNMIIPFFCILSVFWLLTITSLYTFPDRRSIHLIFSLSIAFFSGSIWYHSST